jgi:hypothetical protein
VSWMRRDVAHRMSHRPAGYHGMPSFKIRPKTVSRHGRQNVVDAQGSAVHFSVGNKSRLSTMSVRHNMEVSRGLNTWHCDVPEGCMPDACPTPACLLAPAADGTHSSPPGCRSTRTARLACFAPAMKVNVGESGATVYEVEADLAGRTLQFKVRRQHKRPNECTLTGCPKCCDSVPLSPGDALRRTRGASWLPLPPRAPRRLS